MTDKKQYKEGESVFNKKHGAGKVYMVTDDKTHPVIVKFNNYPVVNYYYSQKGAGVNADCGNIKAI